MDIPTWRTETLDLLRAHLECDDRVIALGVFGSLVNPDVVPDQWSDIDCFLVVTDDAFAAFHESPSWLAELGEILVLTRSIDGDQATVKVIFADFRKLDIVIATRSGAASGAVPLPDQQVLLLKDGGLADRFRDAATPAQLAAPHRQRLPPPTMVDEFWFIAFTTVTKLMRNDLLIALHLGLELQRMTLVLGMMLRDRDLGTNVHRTGGPRNDLVAQVRIDLAARSSHRREILALVERCGEHFDALATELDPEYRARSPHFRALFARARGDLAAMGE